MMEIAPKPPKIVVDETDRELTEAELLELPIYKIELPSANLAEATDRLDKGWRTYGHLFRNREECELFTMLPLNPEQRAQLLKTMLDEIEQKQ